VLAATTLVAMVSLGLAKITDATRLVTNNISLLSTLFTRENIDLLKNVGEMAQ
jgi:hypothetical protein